MLVSVSLWASVSRPPSCPMKIGRRRRASRLLGLPLWWVLAWVLPLVTVLGWARGALLLVLLLLRRVVMLRVC